MKTEGSSEIARQRRLVFLLAVIGHYQEAGKKITDDELLQKCRKAQFYITRPTLARDKRELASNNTFVEDVAKKTYSKIINDCYDSIIFAEDQAREILDKKWTRSKKTTRKSAEQEVTILELTEELAEPKLRALEVIKDCAMAKANLVNGKTLRMSAGMWSKHVEKLEATIDKLRMEKIALEERQVGQNAS